MGEVSGRMILEGIKVRIARSIYITGVLILIGLLAGYLSTRHSDQILIRADIAFAKELCTTDVCKDAAQIIEENRSLMVDPCDNFDEFVCGGWKEKHPTSSLDDDARTQFDETEKNTDSRVKDILESADKNNDLESVKSARKFYRACLSSSMNVNETFRSLVDQLLAWGGWPIISTKWKPDKFDWQKVFVQLERTIDDGSALIGIHIGRDPKNTSRTVLQLAAPDSPKICTLMAKIDNPGVAREFITTSAQHILNFIKHDKPETFEDDVRDITEFATKVCQIVGQPFQTTDDDTFPSNKLMDFQIKSDASFGKESPFQVNWKLQLKEYIYGSGVKLRLDDVMVVQPELLLELLKLIATTPQRTVANYLLLHKVKWTEGLNDESLFSNKKLLEKHCVENTRLTFPHAIGYEYVNLYFTEDDRKTATAIVRTTLDSFITDLSENTWMDESTRSAAIEKAKNMMPIVGYPNWYRSTSEIDDRYSDLEVGDCFTSNMEKATLAKIIYNAKLLHEKAGREAHLQGAAKTNAEYFLSENTLYIPAGILQPPFYVKGRPDALNFGSLVSIIGHEITHAFDLSGRTADKLGNAVPWWSDDSFNAFLAKAKCFEDQYADYYIPELDIVTENRYKHIAGMTTLDENLADNGGLEAAFSAYLRYAGNETKDTRLPGIANYSPEQLFFIGFATIWCEAASWKNLLTDVLFNNHSPSKYRSLITLSNSEDFAKAWDCPLGSRMRPRKTCKLW